MNPKAEKFKKSLMKQTALQSQANTQQLGNNQKMIVNLSLKLFQLDQKVNRLQDQLNRAQSTARYADYRSSALSNLLQQSGSYSEEMILDEIEKLQIADFEQNSAVEDKRKNLEVVTGQPAENGMHAIFIVRLLKGGKELIQERIVRSKMILGDEEDKKQMLSGVHEAIVGMNVGDVKRIPMNLQDKTDEAEITLLGLRKAAPQPEEDKALAQEQAN